MCPNFSHFFLVADDTNIYFKSHDLTQLQKIMNRELKKVKKWLETNRLALNINKTNFVVFHPPRIKIPEPVIIRFDRTWTAEKGGRGAMPPNFLSKFLNKSSFYTLCLNRDQQQI